MGNQIYLCSLFDYYGELLTDKQKKCFKDYYFDNLTLSELSENYQISRNAVHKTIKEVEEKLQFYEQKLLLFDKANKIKKIISTLDDDLKNQIIEYI